VSGRETTTPRVPPQRRAGASSAAHAQRHVAWCSGAASAVLSEANTLRSGLLLTPAVSHINMCEQVASTCEQLIKAVNVMMDPGTSQVFRLEALKVAASR